MKRLMFAVLLVFLLVSCKTTTTEYVYLPCEIDISEPNAILFDARPQTEFLVGDVSTYEGLYAFSKEAVDAYHDWRTYAYKLEAFLKEVEVELKGEIE